ncbi:hypothetical protein DPMN_140197 [Dreissena polymorpha]|uniref:Uncharacterized protein n=1 Tax=Dreissena polymorpha TaxID=45954 RepID=A0A9D4GAE7_DREPO|nr:hypothetical protein DPMN_140197 [Dreissena polymorpha]
MNKMACVSFESFRGTGWDQLLMDRLEKKLMEDRYLDLVKSHLMFAVREEVEVLKEQIAELIERNNQLEHENGILRAAASPETLAKLAQPPPSSSS